MKILIVETQEETALWLTAVLVKKGHRVRLVGSGSQALTAALVDEFDLLICDVQLPDLHGTEIVRALKAQSPMLPVMTIGDGDPEQWTRDCSDAGASCYLAKPITEDALLQEVGLVDKARLRLRTFLVDTDPFHRTRLTKSLMALGCEMTAFESASAARAATVQPGSLLLLDAQADGALEILRWAKELGAVCFVFQEQFDGPTEERLMRAGAALLLNKPIDIEQFLTQAAFMAATR